MEAGDISVDASGFDGALSSGETDVQAALEAIDGLDIPTLRTALDYASPDLDTTVPSDVEVNTYFAPTLTIPSTGFIKFEIDSEPSQNDLGPTFLPATPCGAIRDLTAATAASAVGSGEPITFIIPSTTSGNARFLIGRTSANGLLLAVGTTSLRSAGIKAWIYDQ